MASEELRNKVRERLQKGYSLDEINKALKNDGHPEDRILEAIEQVAESIENTKDPWYKRLNKNQKILMAAWTIAIVLAVFLFWPRGPEFYARPPIDCGTFQGYQNQSIENIVCLITSAADCRQANLTHQQNGKETKFTVRKKEDSCNLNIDIQSQKSYTCNLELKPGMSNPLIIRMNNLTFWKDATYLQTDWSQNPNCVVNKEESFFSNLFS